MSSSRQEYSEARSGSLLSVNSGQRVVKQDWGEESEDMSRKKGNKSAVIAGIGRGPHPLELLLTTACFFLLQSLTRMVTMWSFYYRNIFYV